jgi:spermidine/putrescine transport system substrate-binding protein
VKKIFALSAVLAVLVACGPKEAAPPQTATAPPAGPCELNLFIWSEYMDPEIIKNFEKEFGCKVTIDLYETNEDLIAKLQGGGTSLYDVVVPGQYVVGVMAKLGLLQPLNHANIPNLANLDEKFINPPYDPGNKYSAAYQWGTVGIYMRKPASGQIDESWDLLFKADKAPGPFLLMDSIREFTGSVARYQGWSVNTTDQEQLKKIRDLLLESKKRSQGFDAGVGAKNKVLNKSVTASVVYNGDAIRGMADDPETYYFVPREGGVIWVDNLAIPAKAPHLAAAEKFINYLLDAKVGAQLSNYNQYATPNKAAKAHINPADLANPAIYPPPEMMAKLEFVDDLGDANKLYDEIWTQVKSN